MKKKFFLPMLAMIFAVGMAFATADATVEEYTEKYIQVDGTWRTIGQFSCGIGQAECYVMFQENPEDGPFQVFNSKDDEDPHLGVGGLTNLPGPVPSN